MNTKELSPLLFEETTKVKEVNFLDQTNASKEGAQVQLVNGESVDEQTTETTHTMLENYAQACTGEKITNETMNSKNVQTKASHVGATEQLVKGKSVVDQTNTIISPEQENDAQNYNQNKKNMNELTTPLLEQGKVNAPTPPTAEGGNSQQSSAEDPAQPDNFAEQENTQISMDASHTDSSTELSRCIIYKQSDLESKGYIFGKLGMNRSISDTAVKAKMKSIVVANGVIHPCLICTALECLNQGHSVIRPDNSEVAKSDPDVNKILVIIDGQHRVEAVKRLNKMQKDEEKKEKYECYFNLPLNDKLIIVDILREANVATKPWKGGDFLTYLVLNAPEEVDTEMLKWVQARYGTCGDVASWLWATLNPSRVYLKGKLIKASKSLDEFRKVSKKGQFEYGKKLYEKALAKMGNDLVKLKVVPLTLIDIKEELINKSTTVGKATEMLCAFIDSLKEDDLSILRSCKRNGTDTKDQQIEKQLKSFWKDYNNK